ncbi:MAG: hypothetical protein IPK08_03930 [Bacteroidetes bacterium]|nr:hypothetical protein [Bacteroidota bacterium]
MCPITGTTWQYLVFRRQRGLGFQWRAPVPSTSSIVSRGSCVSLSDSNGDLLFYAHTRLEYQVLQLD